MEEKAQEAIAEMAAIAKTENATEARKGKKGLHGESKSEHAEEKDARELDGKELGRRGEKAALRYLERRGFEVLDTNWTCPFGEADVVAFDGDSLCFIEVKTRRGAEKGFPEEAVDARKRAKYEKVAACYLREHAYVDVHVRFDVIAILVLGSDRAFLRMHMNAFGA